MAAKIAAEKGEGKAVKYSRKTSFIWKKNKKKKLRRDSTIYKFFLSKKFRCPTSVFVCTVRYSLLLSSSSSFSLSGVILLYFKAPPNIKKRRIG
jgi:hypothetical protein